ncbi:hypothetical protein LDENG_00244600 [Lucifuga dentata]|nr:hypothetical protein LDENG_00244600 [Lucifuga dentata]
MTLFIAGLEPVTLFFLLLVLCVLIGAFLYWIRKYRRGANMTKLILTLDNVVFIDTQVSRKVCYLWIYLSYILTTPESSNIGLLEGDWVWLKKIPVRTSVTAVKQSTRNIFSQLREMRHENLNLYLGLFLDSGIFAVVEEHCPRGSLADLLADSDMRLDWMFKSSLLTDLIKVPDQTALMLTSTCTGPVVLWCV